MKVKKLIVKWKSNFILLKIKAPHKEGPEEDDDA